MALPQGKGRVDALHCRFFRNSKSKTAILAKKIHCTPICVAGDISVWAILGNTPKFCGRFRPPTTRWHQRSKTGGGLVCCMEQRPQYPRCVCVSPYHERRSRPFRIALPVHTTCFPYQQKGAPLCAWALGTPFLWILASHQRLV